MRRRALAAVVVILLAGAAVRLHTLNTAYPFHPDEALYGTYARRLARYGEYLFPDVPLDKPPVGIILTGWSFALFGETPFGGRIATVFVSLLTLAAFYALLHSGGRGTIKDIAPIALLLLTVAPFEVSFAATLFHDPLLTLWLISAAMALARQRAAWAGAFAALALATKQSAIQFLPLYALLGISIRSKVFSWRDALRFACPLGIGISALAVWSAARAFPIDFWTLGVTNPGALRWIRAEEVLPRLATWGSYVGDSFGGIPAPLLFSAAALVAAVRHTGRFRAEGVAAVGVLGTFFLYWLVAFPLYDRYLVPLVPLMVILMARGMCLLLGVRRARWVALVVSLAMILPLVALRQDSADLGVAGLARAIKTRLPAESVVWDHWLGWELGWYLGEPVGMKVIWQPTPEAFARAACGTTLTNGHTYFAAPLNGELDRWRMTFAAFGGRMSLLYDQDRLVLYALDCTF